MISPAAPYATVAAGAAGIGTATALDPTSWIEPTTIAGAVVVVSLFWIRRADTEQRRERREMRAALRRAHKLNAILLEHHAEHGLPLPTEYARILGTDLDTGETES